MVRKPPLWLRNICPVKCSNDLAGAVVGLSLRPSCSSADPGNSASVRFRSNPILCRPLPVPTVRFRWLVPLVPVPPVTKNSQKVQQSQHVPYRLKKCKFENRQNMLLNEFRLYVQQTRTQRNKYPSFAWNNFPFSSYINSHVVDSYGWPG